MDTYVQENSTFEAYLNIAQSKFNGKRIGGMCAGTRPPYILHMAPIHAL